MSHLKYIVLGALSLGALAIEPGTAEAALQNVTEAWCKPTGAEDQVIVAGASSTLVWRSSGELVLEPNNRVAPRILLENDRARLALQPDGNLVLRSVSGDEVWHSGLPANRGKRLSFQADGNLVIYDASNVALWAPNVHDQGVTVLDLDGCAFGLKSSTATKWSQGFPTCPTGTITNTPAWSAPASGVLTVLRTPDSRLVWQGDRRFLRTSAASRDPAGAPPAGSSRVRRISLRTPAAGVASCG